MEKSRKYLLVGLLVALTFLLIGATIWLSDYFGWNIWVRQVILGLLFLAMLALNNKMFKK